MTAVVRIFFLELHYNDFQLVSICLLSLLIQYVTSQAFLIMNKQSNEPVIDEA